MSITVVAVDAMGGDNAPGMIVKGAVQAAAQRDDIKILLVGKPDAIEGVLSGSEFPRDRIEIVPASEVIEVTEHPVSALRKKKDSSIVVAMNLVKEGKADAVISAGSSGAVLAGGMLLVGRLKGVERPPFGALLPTEKGPCLLVDSGANVNSKSSHLVQFAQIGSIYMEHVVGVKNPRVAIVNIGAEEEKGDRLVQETMPLLKACEGINFTGSIESREIPHGGADVVVCDAFVGNVIIKLYEGVAGALMNQIKQGLMSTTRSKIGALLAKPALKQTLKKFDASEHGGAPMLGLKGLVVKTHGNSKEAEIRNAVMQCIAFKNSDMNRIISEHLNKETEEAGAHES